MRKSKEVADLGIICRLKVLRHLVKVQRAVLDVRFEFKLKSNHSWDEKQ